MTNWRYIAAHRGGGGFHFSAAAVRVERTLESSLLWALTFGGCAAGLAYAQSNR